MGFRRPKSREHERQKAWGEWVERARPILRSIGLPAEVLLSESHWEDFLENGYLEWHPQDYTGFGFNELPPLAADELRRFLELEYGENEPVPTLLGWLRVRYQEGRLT